MASRRQRGRRPPAPLEENTFFVYVRSWMRGVRNEALRAEVVRLRLRQRLSLRQIAKLTGAGKASVSEWLRPYPLTEAEKKELQSKNLSLARYRAPKKYREIESPLHRLALKPINRTTKARVAETAVLLRAALLGMSVFGSAFDGDKADWIIGSKKGCLYRIQVKFARRGKEGLPYIRLHCSNGRNKYRRYMSGEFDFIVAYDLFADKCYVWSWADVKHAKSTVTVSLAAEERWDKIK